MHMNIFDNDAFSLQMMTSQVVQMPTVPGYLGTLNLFGSESVSTDTVTIERKDYILEPIQTSQRGTEPSKQETEKAKLRAFPIPRVAAADQVFAREIQNVRAFGTDSELVTATQIITQKLAKLLRRYQMTMELHRLSAAQGILLDSNGDVLTNFFDEFGVTQPEEIDFDLDNPNPASGELRTKAANVVRVIARLLGQAFGPGVRVIGLADDVFYDQFVNHRDVVRTYENYQAAASLRTSTAFEEFNCFGIDWVNYKGSDDNSTVAIGTGRVKFIVTGVEGLYRRINGPGEDMETANTLGQEMYAYMVRDLQRNQWVQPEIYSYPLHMCTRPEALLRGRNT